MISVKDLFFTYAGNDKETLKGLDFEVKKARDLWFLRSIRSWKINDPKDSIWTFKRIFW